MQNFNISLQLLQFSIFINITLGKTSLSYFFQHIHDKIMSYSRRTSVIVVWVHLRGHRVSQHYISELYFAVLSSVTGDTENSFCRSRSWGVSRVSDFLLTFLFFISTAMKRRASQAMYIKKSANKANIYTSRSSQCQKNLSL